MKIVSLTPTDPAKSMNDWQIEARIAHLDRRISEIQWHFDHEPNTPLSLAHELLDLSRERNHLRVEQAWRLLEIWKQTNTQPETAASRWTIYKNPKQDRL